MTDELITVEYAGPTTVQVGVLPCYDVRAWWTVRSEGSEGRVKLAAGHELKKHVPADHVEFVRMDADTYNSPHVNAMVTFRVLTAAQYAARAELRSRTYRKCDGCTSTSPGQLVRPMDGTAERALCYACWEPLRAGGGWGLVHWINRHGRLSV